MIDPKLVLERIRGARKQRNYTIAQFAEKLNMSASAYTKLENGQTALTIDRINEIAALLAIDFTALILPENASDFSIILGQLNERMTQVERILHVIVSDVNTLKNEAKHGGIVRNKESV
jgi:transcriptional regulator with XRE-family HTH domain